MAIQLHHSIAVHPGIWLRDEIVAPHNLTVGAAAELLHVSRQALSTLINGRASLTPTMAIRFEKVFGLRADTLIRMQARWDIAQARAHADDVEVERCLVEV